MKKKNGGKISHWQLHHIKVPVKVLKVFKQQFPGIIMPPMIFTGSVVDDPTGRWQPGYHMRSTYIVSLNRKTGRVETLNTIYKLDMKTEGQDGLPDLGNAALSIFY